jgi:hypothetical protein
MAMTILEYVRLVLRKTGTAFDEEISNLIASAKLDLAVAGVTNIQDTDPLIRQAIATYCKANFGEADDYDRLKRSYDEQKAQLATNTGTTDWDPDHPEPSPEPSPDPDPEPDDQEGGE